MLEIKTRIKEKVKEKAGRYFLIVKKGCFNDFVNYPNANDKLQMQMAYANANDKWQMHMANGKCK